MSAPPLHVIPNLSVLFPLPLPATTHARLCMHACTYVRAAHPCRECVHNRERVFALVRIQCGPWKPFVADRGNLSGSRGREPRGILLLLLRLRASPLSSS